MSGEDWADVALAVVIGLILAVLAVVGLST